MANLNRRSKPRYVNSMFARIAPRYDLLNAIMTGRRDAAWRRTTAGLAASNCQGRLLDVATGSGDLALALAHLTPAAHLCGVDFTAQMLHIARRKAVHQGLANKIDFVHGDALALPFPDGTFGAATMGFALRNVADIGQALSEVRRVLRPGARFANLELTPLPVGLRAGMFRLYFHRIVPLLGGIIAGDLAAYRYLPNSLTGFPPAGELAMMMRAIGFVEVSYLLLAGGTVAIHVGVR